MEKIIKLSELPREVLDKIPFSIRVKQDIYEFNELPTEIKYIINKYHEMKVEEINYDTTFDFMFDISEYSDFRAIKSKKNLILHYLKNYLITRITSYPYDVDFGCALKDQVQTKDTSLRQTLIYNELVLVSGVLGVDYNMKIVISELSLQKIDMGVHTEYSAVIRVKLEDDEYEITV